jgi:hypothetical protein
MRKRTENPRLSGPSLSLFLLLLLLLRKRGGCFRWCEKENRLFKALLFSDVSLRSLCRGGCSFFPNASNKKVQSWLVGEKSRSLSRKRARRQETRADATERESLRRRGSFLRGGESMLLPKMVVRIIARTSDARTTCD